MTTEIIWSKDEESICESVRQNCLYMSRENKNNTLN